MNKCFSKKYAKITALDVLLKSTNDHSEADNKLIIHTANGIYIGNFKEQFDQEILDFNDEDDILTSCEKIYLRICEQYENTENSTTVPEISENSISIDLEDVLLITSGKNVKLPFVKIFIDQIIGISLGSLDSLV